MSKLVALALLVLLALPATSRAEFVADESSFQCLTQGVKPEGRAFFVFHKNKGKRRKAAKLSERTDLGKKKYPVGTILQLFPFEAMVKRGGKYNREGGGWEFFRLRPHDDGTTEIVARGGPEVANNAGSCQGCHTNVTKDPDTGLSKFDFVCEFVIGASGLGLTDEQIAALQAADPRCTPQP